MDVLKLRWDGVIFLAGQQLWAFDAATARLTIRVPQYWHNKMN